MHRNTTLFLIGLCLIAILGFNFFVVQTSALLGAVVILGIVFIAGGLTGYWLAKVSTSTQYEAGVEKDDYLINVANTFEAQLKNAHRYATNTKNLANGLRYLWFRKAEYTAQYYINETEFPKEKVAENSGVKADFLNITSSLIRSVDSVVGFESVFFKDTLSGFDTLDVKNYYSDSYQYSLKNKDQLGLFRAKEDDSATQLTFYGIYHDFLVHKPYFGVYRQNSDTETCNITVYNVETNSIVETWSFDFAGQTREMYWFKSDPSKYTEGEKYKIVIKKTGSSAILRGYIPAYFIPYDDDDVGLYRICQVTNRTGGSSAYWVAHVYKLRYISDSEVVEEVGSGALCNSGLQNAIEELAMHYEDALSSGQAYWNYLRMLGYENIDDVPESFKIPAPSVVDIDSSVTEKLTPEQLYALYVAYLKAMEKFFTSTTYRQAEMSSVDVKMSDFSVVINATAYSGDSVVFDKKFAIFMPTVENLTLTKGQNNTLTQTVNCVYYDNSTLTNQTMNYVELHSGDIVYVHEIYINGNVSDVENVTISIADLRQVALTYDFVLVGDPTYAYTTFNDWIPIIMTVLVVSMVIAVIDKTRRKR